MSPKHEEFERTALPHLRGLLRFARRLTGNPEQAEDLAQETFLLAWRGFSRFTPGTNIRAWLFRILLNAHRERGRRRTALALIKRPEAVASEQQRIEVMDALDRLPEDQRVVLALSVIEGFTGPEVAEILQLPLGTVMSRLSRARQAMRSMLTPAFEKVSK